MTLEKIALPLPEGAPSEEETVWAEPMGDDLFRLDNSPWFAFGCALGDVVLCSNRAGRLPLFKSVAESSGNLAVRIFVPEGHLRASVKSEIFSFLNNSGCKYEGFGADKGLIAVTIPSTMDAESILSKFREYQSEEKAYWESANF